MRASRAWIGENLILCLLPTGIGVELLYRLGNSAGLFSEIPLINDSIAADDKGHYARRAVFRRKGCERKSSGHFAIYDVVLHAARGILSLYRQDPEVITTVRRQRTLALVGIALGDGGRHQRSNWTLGFARGRLPVQAVVLPFVTEEFAGKFLSDEGQH